MKRVLIVSHNVFSKTSNMGKTLSSFFSGWEGELAQFYIHAEIPTERVCENYYRVTDSEVLKSIFTRRSGTVFTAADIEEERSEARTDSGMLKKIYQKGRKGTPLYYAVRNAAWRLGKWYTKKLRAWLDEFQPEAIFFASGDYAFMYRVALKIAKERKIPLYVCCFDDYYFNNKNAGVFGGKRSHKKYMKQVRKTMDYASGIFTVCDKMSADYAKLFHKPAYTLYTVSAFEGPLQGDRTNQISYIGNLDHKRHEQLLDIARTLKGVDAENNPRFIDVYSAEQNEEILREFTEESGIRFHGKINAEEVKEVMGKSLLLIHTESFDEDMRKKVAYSVSTKIADSIASGTCFLAYGPKEVASIEYLIENKAAVCITDKENLAAGLKEILENASLREERVTNALKLSRKNHSRERVDATLRENIK